MAGLILAGCATNQPVWNPPDPAKPDYVAKLRIGDTIRVEFSNLSATQIPPHEEQIKDDGTITLPYLMKVQAAGKTTGALQNELQEGFKKYFREMNVTVKAPDRFYSVGGEVKLPNRQAYVGGTTVIKAIQSAGDLTQYANRKKIILTRSDGRSYTINYDKALKNPNLDLLVYPGDQIHVPQRYF